MEDVAIVEPEILNKMCICEFPDSESWNKDVHQDGVIKARVKEYVQIIRVMATVKVKSKTLRPERDLF